MDSDPTSDIDSLFTDEESFQVEQIKILLIGSKDTYDEIGIHLGDKYNLYHVYNIDNAISFLLQENFVIIILDSDAKAMNTVEVSNAVRTNHSLARIIVISKKPKSSNIAEMMNYGSVDAFLTHPLTYDSIYRLISEQEAKYDISKTLTSFVSQPPKLSKASYLLLDPSLSFADENISAKFVGIMIVSMSVPKYSKFFEEFLAQDDILFAGYLSSITLMGKELFTSREPLKEINFGGISVIFRFHEDIQLSIFVRNLTRHNVEKVEDKISQVVDKIILAASSEFSEIQISIESENSIDQIVKEFEDGDEIDLTKQPKEISKIEGQIILIYGSDAKEQNKLRQKLEKKELLVKTTILEEEAIKILQNENCGVVLLDSTILSGRQPLDFAEFAKEIAPSIQIIYRIRDMKTSSNVISGLNSGLITYMLPYKEWFGSFDKILKWTRTGLEKSLDIKELSTIGEGIEGAADQISIARTILRKDEEAYKVESKPELHGILITKTIELIYEKFWEYDGEKIQFEQEMLAGLVASLESVGEEMFSEEETIGGLELGGANVLVKHRGDFNISFFVKNVDPNTSVMINKEITSCANELFDILSITNAIETIRPNLDETAQNIFRKFSELFG